MYKEKDVTKVFPSDRIYLLKPPFKLSKPKNWYMFKRMCVCVVYCGNCQYFDWKTIYLFVANVFCFESFRLFFVLENGRESTFYTFHILTKVLTGFACSILPVHWDDDLKILNRERKLPKTTTTKKQHPFFFKWIDRISKINLRRLLFWHLIIFSNRKVDMRWFFIHCCMCGKCRINVMSHD